MKDYIVEGIRSLNKDVINKILQCEGKEQQILFETARYIRKNGKFGENVELRSVIELSNICAQKCKILFYCKR